ncbi:MAG: hypothetical protein ACE5G1_04160, partial [bacterium]
MNENIKVFLQICGITFIVFLVSVSFVSYFGNSGLVWSVAWGYGISLVNILFAYYSITWAFDKPNKTFLGVVIGGSPEGAP